jgi:hypothetical protein
MGGGGACAAMQVHAMTRMMVWRVIMMCVLNSSVLRIKQHMEVFGFRKVVEWLEVAAAAEAAAARAEHEKPRAKGVHMSQMFLLLLLLFLFHELFSSCPMVVFVFSSCSVWRERRGEMVPLVHNDLVDGFTNASTPKPHPRPLCNTLLRRHRRQAGEWRCTHIVWELGAVYTALGTDSMPVVQA